MRVPPNVADRLADFVCAQHRPSLTEQVRHDAQRLLLNQLKAAAEAALQPEGLRLLDPARRPAGPAQVWWSDRATTPERALVLHQRLLGLLDFGDTHLPSLGQFTAGIVPGLLAQAEAGGQDGRQVLEALAVGLEVDIAGAQLGGALPLGLGAVAARCTLLGFDHRRTATALADTGMAGTASPEALDALGDLGQHWQLSDIALHCRPLPALALAPVEAVLALRPLAGGQALRSMQLALSPQAWQLAAGGGELRQGMAAAWLLGQFTAEECGPACREDATVQSLSARIELSVDEDSAGLQACALRLQFEDGSSRHTRVDAFLGAPGHPLSDSQLSELFRNAADDLVLPRRAGEILQALWGLDTAADVRPLLALLRRPA